MRKSTKLLALAIGLSVVVTANGVVAASSSGSRDAITQDGSAEKCPVRPVPPLYGQLDEVVAAARKLLIRGTVTAQGRTIKLTTKNSPIYAAVVLARTGGTPFPGLRELRAAAAKRCGAATMEASWAIKIGVPALLIDSSARTVFLIKTRSGWKAY
jgi:hypothetical protein